MKICIFGAGSLGVVLGAFVNKGGVRADLVHHNKAVVDALNEKGAHVVGTVDFTQPVRALLPEEMDRDYDIVILLTKQIDNEAVATFLKDRMAPDGVLVTLQNGLPEEGLARVLGEEKVLGCTVAWGATLKGPGVSELTSHPDSLTFSLGSTFKTPNPHLEDVKRVLELMGPVTVEENFIGARWSKLLINSAFSGMSTVLGCTFGEAAKPMASRKIVLALIKECIDVCAKAGIRIEPVQGKDAVKLLDYRNPLKKALSLFILPIAIRKHALLKASMLQDIEKGKTRTEVDGINGAIAAFGRKVGCPTPLNDKVTELIHRIEKGELKPGFDNLRFF